jgi:orotate phosphoribosyltransferase
VQSFKGEFLDFAFRQQVLLFGEFKTKAGRLSPYFFNAGLFNDGLSAEAARRILREGHRRLGPGVRRSCSGPPTRAFPWPPAVAIALAAEGRNLPFSYNRKEAKDHGEGGTIVGARWPDAC